jgi:MFS family permease
MTEPRASPRADSVDGQGDGQGDAPGRVLRSGLTLAVLVDTFGTGMFMPLVLPYLTVVNGVDPAAAGTAVAVATVVSLLFAAPIGWLLGRVGAKSGLIVATCLSIAGYLGFLPVTTGPAVLAAFLLVAVGDRLHAAAWPVMAALTFGRATLVSVFATVETLKTACLLGGVLTSMAAMRLGTVPGLRVALAANVLTYAVSLLFLRGVLADERRRAGEAAGTRLRPRVLRDRRFALLLTSQTFLTTAWLVPLTVLPLYILEVLHGPAFLATAPLLLRYGIIIASQIRLTRRTLTWNRPRLVVVCAGLAVGGVGAAGSMAGLPPGQQLVAGAVAVVLLATSEVLGKPSGAALAVHLSPRGDERAYTSLYQLTSGIPVALLPALVGVLLDRPALLWGALTVPLLAAGLLGAVETRLGDRPGR